MKKSFYLLLIVLLGSCHKVADMTDINFELTYEQTVGIPTVNTPLPAGGTNIDFPTYAVFTNSGQKLSDYNAKKEKVREITIMQFGWLYLSPGYNFDCFDTVQFYLSAPGQPERLAAYNYDIPKGVTVLNFHVENEINLKKYLLADTVYYRMRAHVNAAPPSSNSLRVLSTYHVIASPVF